MSFLAKQLSTNTFNIIKHVKSQQCSLCLSQLKSTKCGRKGVCLTKIKSVLLYHNYKVILDPMDDRLCTQCSTIPCHQLKLTPQAKQSMEQFELGQEFNSTIQYMTRSAQILQSLWFKGATRNYFISQFGFENIGVMGVTKDYINMGVEPDHHMTPQEVKQYANKCKCKTKKKRPRCDPLYLDGDEIETLTNASFNKLNHISEHIVHELKHHGFSSVEAAIKQMHETDEETGKTTSWKKKLCDINVHNCRKDHYRITQDLYHEPQDLDKYNHDHDISPQAKKVRKSIFYFLCKSKTKLTNTVLAVYHRYHERQIRRLFHQGRLFMSTFFTPFWFGPGHLTREDMLAKQSNVATIVNALSGLTMVILLDSTKIKQYRFLHYNSDYNSFDVSKHYPTRGYVGIDTTSGYTIDMVGGNCTNGKHGDGHLFNWITQNNINSFNTLFDCERDLFGGDRGYKFCLTNTPYLMILPCITHSSKDNPIHCFLANCSRLLTNIRWIKEATFAHYVKRWEIFEQRIIAPYKKYIDSWIWAIVAYENFCKPKGWVKDIDADNPTINLIKYNIKTQFFGNRLKKIVNELDRLHNDPTVEAKSQEHLMTFIVKEDIVRKIIPGMDIIENLTDEELSIFGGGTYCFNQSPAYISHNMEDTTENLPGHDPVEDCLQQTKMDLYISLAQVDYNDWVATNTRIEEVSKGGKRAVEIEKLKGNLSEDDATRQLAWFDLKEQEKKKKNDKCATQRCLERDELVILQCTLNSRHTRKNEAKKTYDVFIAFDKKGYEDATHQHTQNDYDWKDDFDEIPLDDKITNVDELVAKQPKIEEEDEFYNNKYSQYIFDIEEEQKFEKTTDTKLKEKYQDKMAKYIKAQNTQYKALFGNEENIANLEVNDSKIPRKLKYLFTMCTCPHGERTLGTCVHRVAALRLLRNLFKQNAFQEPNFISKAHGDLLYNIENKHEFKPTTPGNWWRDIPKANINHNNNDNTIPKSNEIIDFKSIKLKQKQLRQSKKRKIPNNFNKNNNSIPPTKKSKKKQATSFNVNMDNLIDLTIDDNNNNNNNNNNNSCHTDYPITNFTNMTVDQAERDLGRPHNTVSQIIEKYHEFGPTISKNLQCQIVQKCDHMNDSLDCHNKFPKMLPTVRKLRINWPYRRDDPNDNNVRAVDLEDLAPGQNDTNIYSFFRLHINGVGYYDKDSSTKLASIVETKEKHMKQFITLQNWLYNKPSKWYNFNPTIWEDPQEGDWQKVQDLICNQLKIHEQTTSDCSVFSLRTLADKEWVEGEVITAFAMQLNNRQSPTMQCVCLNTNIGGRLNGLLTQSSITGNANRLTNQLIACARRKIAKGQHGDENGGLDGALRASIKQWISNNKPNRPSIHTLLWPLNLNNNHWTYHQVDINNKIIWMHNSLVDYGLKTQQIWLARICMHLVRLLDESDLSQYLAINQDENFDKDEWNNMNWKPIPMTGKIIQYNNTDCGVFVCCSMEALVLNKFHQLKFTENEDYQMGRLHILRKLVLG